jgi:hypothetical protein
MNDSTVLGIGGKGRWLCPRIELRRTELAKNEVPLSDKQGDVER